VQKLWVTVFRDVRLQGILKNKCDCVFLVVFFGYAYANDHLRPKVWYEHDCKNMENLLVEKKMLIFDRKILASTEKLISQRNNRCFQIGLYYTVLAIFP